MDIQIITTGLKLNLLGVSGTAINKDYTGTAFRLMDKMWKVVKTKGLKNKGLNVWVYESNEEVFAGVEPYGSPAREEGLEERIILLAKYAYYKHVGPYSLIKQVGQNMVNELKTQGLEIIPPYVEIYGHWTNDESKLETELLMNLE